MRGKMGWMALLLAALTACGSVGCNLSCNEMGYSNGLHLSFTAHAPGSYLLRIDGDRVRGECAVAVDRQGQIRAERCRTELGSITDYAYDGSPEMFLMGDDEQPPSWVRFTVTREGDAPGSWTAQVSPEYDESEPNGEGCGVAYSANAMVHLPAPQLASR